MKVIEYVGAAPFNPDDYQVIEVRDEDDIRGKHIVGYYPDYSLEVKGDISSVTAVNRRLQSKLPHRKPVRK